MGLGGGEGAVGDRLLMDVVGKLVDRGLGSSVGKVGKQARQDLNLDEGWKREQGKGEGDEVSAVVFKSGCPVAELNPTPPPPALARSDTSHGLIALTRGSIKVALKLESGRDVWFR